MTTTFLASGCRSRASPNVRPTSNSVSAPTTSAGSSSRAASSAEMPPKTMRAPGATLSRLATMKSTIRCRERSPRRAAPPCICRPDSRPCWRYGWIGEAREVEELAEQVDLAVAGGQQPGARGVAGDVGRRKPLVIGVDDQNTGRTISRPAVSRRKNGTEGQEKNAKKFPPIPAHVLLGNSEFQPTSEDYCTISNLCQRLHSAKECRALARIAPGNLPGRQRRAPASVVSKGLPSDGMPARPGRPKAAPELARHR